MGGDTRRQHELVFVGEYANFCTSVPVDGNRGRSFHNGAASRLTGRAARLSTNRPLVVGSPE